MTPEDSTSQPPQTSVSLKDDDVQKNRDVAALSYVWVLSVFIFFLKKDSAFVKFHSKQAMLLFALSVVFWFIPVIGRLLELVILAGMALGFLAAAQGEWKDVPFIGPLSRGEATLRETWHNIVQAIIKLWKNVRASSKKAPNTPNQTPPQTAPLPPTPPPPTV